MTVYYDPKTTQRRVVAGRDPELEAAGWVEVEPEPDEYPPVTPDTEPTEKKATTKRSAKK